MFRQEIVAGVDVGIVLRIRIERGGKGDLVLVFRQMRLHVAIRDARPPAPGLISICSGVEVMAKRGLIA